MNEEYTVIGKQQESKTSKKNNRPTLMSQHPRTIPETSRPADQHVDSQASTRYRWVAASASVDDCGLTASFPPLTVDSSLSLTLIAVHSPLTSTH